MFYNGNAKLEPGAVVCRVARSFVRFGTFQLPASRGEDALVGTLADYVIKHHYAHLAGRPDARAACVILFICAVRSVAVRHAELGLDVRPAPDLGTATRASEVVVTCTPAKSAFLDREHISPGTFIAAVGADSPDKQEIAPALVAASSVVCDLLEQCEHVGDLHHALAAGLMTTAQVRGDTVTKIWGHSWASSLAHAAAGGAASGAPASGRASSGYTRTPPTVTVSFVAQSGLASSAAPKRCCVPMGDSRGAYASSLSGHSK
jgi:hypothetical protein